MSLCVAMMFCLQTLLLYRLEKKAQYQSLILKSQSCGTGNGAGQDIRPAVGRRRKKQRKKKRKEEGLGARVVSLRQPTHGTAGPTRYSHRKSKTLSESKGETNDGLNRQTDLNGQSTGDGERRRGFQKLWAIRWCQGRCSRATR